MDIASWPFYDEEQINAAKNVLSSGKVNNGQVQNVIYLKKNIAFGAVPIIQ